MIKLSDQANAQIWAQISPQSKIQLRNRLFFLALKQLGGIYHEPSQDNGEASTAPSLLD